MNSYTHNGDVYAPLLLFELLSCSSYKHVCTVDLAVTTVSPVTGENTNCPIATHFQCINQEKCIRREWLCDDFEDCVDGSDEENCVPCKLLRERWVVWRWGLSYYYLYLLNYPNI